APRPVFSSIQGGCHASLIFDRTAEVNWTAILSWSQETPVACHRILVTMHSLKILRGRAAMSCGTRPCLPFLTDQSSDYLAWDGTGVAGYCVKLWSKPMKCLCCGLY